MHTLYDSINMNAHGWEAIVKLPVIEMCISTDDSKRMKTDEGVMLNLLLKKIRYH